MFLFDMLNCDLNQLIYFHLNACTIQKCARRWLYRHTRHESWRYLRKQLLQKIQINEFNELAKYERIRKEWNQEPQSWIYTLQYDRDMVYYILREVRLGLWN